MNGLYNAAARCDLQNLFFDCCPDGGNTAKPFSFKLLFYIKIYCRWGQRWMGPQRRKIHFTFSHFRVECDIFLFQLLYLWAAAIAPWFSLRLPSYGPGFESQAHHLCFFQFILLKLEMVLLLECGENENKQKSTSKWPNHRNCITSTPFEVYFITETKIFCFWKWHRLFAN